tara:strand:- start:593 stop:808 length:216 start_codon:yes stop_codon:yes gene_type:complete
MDIFVLVITIWGNNGTDWVYVGNQYVMKEQFTLEQCQMIARDSNWREFKTNPYYDIQFDCFKVGEQRHDLD